MAREKISFLHFMKLSLSALGKLRVSSQHVNGRERLVAHVAPDIAGVFRHVPRERNLVSQNLAAQIARGAAQVALVVGHAALARTVRYVAHAANEAPVALEY